ncbi:RNase A-like domain-containing protein [Deinococcus misasensis]|uniref:RNase A-like domain-containing protein n=1 Tax=Deinococcus misasensis TaxID=392413 RepID=UPI001470563B
MIERHVGRTPNQLFDRIRASIKPNGQYKLNTTSSFLDQQTTQAAVDHILNEPSNIQ